MHLTGPSDEWFKLRLQIHWYRSWCNIWYRRHVYALYLWRLGVWLYHYACAILATRKRKWSIEWSPYLSNRFACRGNKPAGHTWRDCVCQTMGVRYVL